MLVILTASVSFSLDYSYDLSTFMSRSAGTSSFANPSSSSCVTTYVHLLNLEEHELSTTNLQPTFMDLPFQLPFINIIAIHYICF